MLLFTTHSDIHLCIRFIYKQIVQHCDGVSVDRGDTPNPQLIFNGKHGLIIIVLHSRSIVY